MAGLFDDEHKGFTDGRFGIGRRSFDEDYTRGWMAGSSIRMAEEEDDDYF